MGFFLDQSVDDIPGIDLGQTVDRLAGREDRLDDPQGIFLGRNGFGVQGGDEQGASLAQNAPQKALVIADVPVGVIEIAGADLVLKA